MAVPQLEQNYDLANEAITVAWPEHQYFLFQDRWNERQVLFVDRAFYQAALPVAGGEGFGPKRRLITDEGTLVIEDAEFPSGD